MDYSKDFRERKRDVWMFDIMYDIFNPPEVNKLYYLKVGETYDEEELVRLFCTPKQIEKYIENGYFVSSNKKTFIKTYEKYCRLNPIGKKKYQVVSINDVFLPQYFDKMKDGKYLYVCSKLLRFFLESPYTVFSYGQLCRKSSLFADSYVISKVLTSNKDNLSPLDCEFYRRFEIKNERELQKVYKNYNKSCYKTIDNALKYLSCDYIKVNKTVVVKRIIIDNDIDSTDDENKENEFVVKNTITELIRVATDEDLEIIKNAESQIDKKLNIAELKERYFSDKSKKWRKEVRKILSKYGIEFYYNSFSVSIVNSHLARKLLNLLDEKIIDLNMTEKEKDSYHKLTQEEKNINLNIITNEKTKEIRKEKIKNLIENRKNKNKDVLSNPIFKEIAQQTEDDFNEDEWKENYEFFSETIENINKDYLFSYEEKQRFFSSKENVNIRTDIKIKNEVNFSILL